MKTHPLQLFKCLSDDTRLSCVLLIHHESELCVCELTEALNVSQPKISRHLAQLRDCGILEDRREGQWVFYRINPKLSSWALDVIDLTHRNNQKSILPLCRRLSVMGERPQRKAEYC